jgi:NAD(P)-dependent dehydrogenase (short-subunit alcohol dehydrogenase family)
LLTPIADVQGFAASFARANPKGIVLVARSAETLKAVEEDVRSINSSIKVLAVPTNLSDSKDVSALWDKVQNAFGHADILINNAGILNNGLVAEAPAESWWADFVSLLTLSLMNVSLTFASYQETNVRGTFITTQGFLKLLGKENKGYIVNLTTGGALQVVPGLSSYSLSKLVALQIQAYVAAENPNVVATALHPGVVMTDMTMDAFKRFAKDTPQLVGGVGNWLASDKAAFLNGKYITANWCVAELSSRKDEIVSEGKLSIGLVGKFGKEQFA